MDSSSGFRVQNTFPQFPASVAGTSDSRPKRTNDGANDAISVVDPCPQQFISTLFLVEKGPGTGEFRPVINLKALNRFLPKEKFKMEGLHTARSLLREGDYMMKLDLKDAYYAVLIHPESRKYLRFQFKGPMYEFHCLPFGLSLAPRVFTRILRPIMGKLRSEGIRAVICLDHLLLIHHQKDTLGEIFPLCAETFVQPGFHSEIGEMLSGTNLSLSLSGCGIRHNLHVSCPAGGTDQSDTGRMPGNARVSVNIPRRAVEPLGPHELCRTDGTVGSTIVLQSPAAPGGSASPPVRMETKVSDIIVSTLPG